MNRHASAEGWMPKCQVVCKVGYCGARWGSSQGVLVLQRWHMCCLTVTDDSEISTIDPTISSNVLTEAAVEFTSDEYVKSAARRLVYWKDKENITAFSRRQQIMGMTYMQHNLHTMMQLDSIIHPFSQFMHDCMQTDLAWKWQVLQDALVIHTNHIAINPISHEASRICHNCITSMLITPACRIVSKFGVFF